LRGSIALAIVARYVNATFLGPQPEYSHWIDEMQFEDGPVSRTEVFMAKPNKLSVRVTIGGQAVMAFGFDGTTGWSFAPATGVTTVTGPEVEAMRAGVTSLGAVPVASDVRLVAGGKVMLEGEFTDLVLTIDTEGDTTETYYAVHSGLLSARRLPPATGERGRTITLYRDHKPFGGEQIATTKISLLSTGTKWTTRMVHMSSDPIPEERFRRP
jgi:hypothetical protein